MALFFHRSFEEREEFRAGAGGPAVAEDLAGADVAARIRTRIRPGICSRPAPRLRSSSPAMPSAAYQASHTSTVGRDTPACTAISDCARHQTTADLDSPSGAD
nr:hypothetical protein [Nocardia sp. CNY236]